MAKLAMRILLIRKKERGGGAGVGWGKEGRGCGGGVGKREMNQDGLHKGGKKAFHRLPDHLMHEPHEYEVHVGNL